jgi:uncharacterized repeat protein (TIGR03803 family)
MFWAVTPTISAAQTFKNLANFDQTNGEQPVAGVVQGRSGDFYGTTDVGGAYSEGTVFKLTPGGVVTALYSFGTAENDGTEPQAGLVLATNGSFYGTTSRGGANRYGTVFEITPAGVETVLYSFCNLADCDDGGYPYAGLVQGTDGNFYGTTYEGGTSGDGTVFKLTSKGVLTTLHSFCTMSGCPDGENPYYAALIQGTDGNFYGFTYNGGANGDGTIFKISSSGTFTTVLSFDETDGYNPYAALVQAANGELYGVTEGGGSYGNHTSGTVFETTTAGKLSTLVDFDNTDGRNPEGALCRAPTGIFTEPRTTVEVPLPVRMVAEPCSRSRLLAS